MSASADRPIPRSVGAQFTLRLILLLLICLSSGLAQNAALGSTRYELKTETEVKGVVDEVKLIDLTTWRTGKYGPH